ncbi:LPXTG cell wall anchor domain-containing protein [Actinoplanes sp. RD1]|uniref:LPXTG cell wall anchor domain-containing protein n=1 Tax=Actinoplanes sp. RD1 TaxID=3064538 RepID=UPI0027406ABD|nr:LPXTG cell wall anchor domain-containing protein [Actinoplanes sp. RD1]
MRAFAAAAATAALVALTAAPAAAAPRPSNPQGAAVTLAASTVAAGTSLRFTGTGWINDGGRGQVVTVKLDDTDILTTVTASDGGAISGAATVPAATTAGDGHWLRFLAGSGQENDTPARSLASSEFTVTAAPGGDSTSAPTPAVTATAGSGTGDDLETLPKTGVDSGPWLAGAIGLPLAGFALLLAERRRRRRAAS